MKNLYLQRKLTQKQIAKKFGHSSYGIQRWMKIYGIKGRSYYESHKVSPKYDFSGDSVEKAYLIGFRLGDLNIYRVKNLIQARCSSTIPNQISLIRNLFEKYGHVHVWKAKRGTFEIVVLLNKSFSFLIPKQDRIEKWILKRDKYFLSFLAGYSDAEGSYYLKRSHYKRALYPSGMFEIQTYDKNLLATISYKLEGLNIKNTYRLSRKAGKIDKRGVINNKDVWKITISRKQSLWNFIKLIKGYHQHKSKLEDLKKVENNIIIRNSTPRYQKIIL